jgi:hypothetical protein
MLKISPKLLRPVVEKDVRLDDGWLGDGCGSVSCIFVTESSVEDLALFLGRPWLRPPLIEGVECTECAELDESFRMIGGREADKPADDREGDGKGDTWSCPSEASDPRVGPSGTDLDWVKPGVCPLSAVGFGGNGNWTRFLFRRGMRNRLVPEACPPRGEFVRDISLLVAALWSDREDSENR